MYWHFHFGEVEVGDAAGLLQVGAITHAEHVWERVAGNFLAGGDGRHGCPVWYESNICCCLTWQSSHEVYLTWGMQHVSCHLGSLLGWRGFILVHLQLYGGIRTAKINQAPLTASFNAQWFAPKVWESSDFRNAMVQKHELSLGVVVAYLDCLHPAKTNLIGVVNCISYPIRQPHIPHANPQNPQNHKLAPLALLGWTFWTKHEIFSDLPIPNTWLHSSPA